MCWKNLVQVVREHRYLYATSQQDMNEKIVGTAMLLQLVQDPVNLEYFIESDTILGALSRTLIEGNNLLDCSLISDEMSFSEFEERVCIDMHRNM